MLCGLLVFPGVPEAAGLQRMAQAATATVPKPTPADPGGKQDATNLVAEEKPPETNWSAKCDQDDLGEKTNCRVVQSIQLTKTKQTLLSVLVRRPSGDVRPLMTLNLPHGLYLPAGTTIKIDQTQAFGVPVETCDAKGCYASLSVEDEMLTALKKGATMIVTFQNLARQPINVPVTLVGFTAAFEKIQ